MEIKKVNFKGLTVVGLPAITNVDECMKDNKLPALWNSFCKRMDEIKDKTGVTMYGVSESSFGEEGNSCSFRYTASIEAKATPKGMIKIDIPAGKYIVVTHKGKIENICTTYGAMNEELKKKCIEEDGIWFEVYNERFKEGSKDSETDIYTKIKES